MNDGGYPYPLARFTAGMRVELHPATDLWMAGARYGTVTATGRTYVSVKLDKVASVKRFRLGLLRPVEGD